MTTDQRLARLERQCRFFKAGFALVTVALAAILLIGAGQEQDKPKVLEEVRAKRFVLMDGEGKSSALVETRSDHIGPSFCVYDENGFPRVMLDLSDKGTPMLWFAHPSEGSPTKAALCGVQLGINKFGLPEFRFRDKDGRTRMELACPMDDQPSFRLIDKSGTPIFKAPK